MMDMETRKRAFKLLELRYNHNHDDRGRFCSGKGLTSGSESGIINQAKTIDMFNDNDITDFLSVTSQQIIDELSKSSIGRETIKDIEGLPERIVLSAEFRSDGVRGLNEGNSITIYIRNCKNVQWIARTIIHEVTHYKYGIGESQWAECVCVAQELKHARNRDKLTVSDLRKTVSAVKSVYDNYNWRRGGVIYGRRKSHIGTKKRK